MIDFRFHLVSTIAVLLALALGTALGSTLLKDPLLNTLRGETADLRSETDRLADAKEAAEQRSAGAGRLVGAYADAILDGELNGVSVAVVESPGTDPKLREGVVRRIEQAGGTVPGRLSVSPDLLQEDESAFVRELTDQLATGAALPDGSARERAGVLLGRAVLKTGGGKSGDAESGFDAAAALAGFAEAGLLTVHGEPAGAADTVVLLASGADAGGEAAPTAAMLDAADGLHAAAQSAVLVGAPAAAERGGLVEQARRAGASYSTVDAAGSTVGDVAAALAVAAAVDGRTGSYGTAEGTDGFLPDPPPADGDEEGGDDEGRESPDSGLAAADSRGSTATDG